MRTQTDLERVLAARGVNLDTCSDRELMYALTAAVRQLQKPMDHARGQRKLYYFSAEFLVGRLLRANLINLGLLEEAERLLAAHGRSLAQVEDQEPEPSLGNGGLGRLFSGFHRLPGPQRGRGGPQLPLRPVPPAAGHRPAD